MSHKISKEELLFELYIAEEDARRHKSNKKYVIDFEKNLHSNLLKLCDELFYHTYNLEPSTCFIINEPKKREIFASNFRDRVVHHLYFNLTHNMFERTFIYDSYSCIKNRGTHFGINRLYSHIKKESNNYRETCYILKMDISGYFMHINRDLLLDITTKTLEKERFKLISSNSNLRFDDVLDFEFIYYLTNTLIMSDPTIDCIFKSKKSDWIGLPPSKSLFNSPKNCGLPIGNLTSQLFSNVFLNKFDQYCKRELRCKHYGRYVDDFYIVSKDKNFLKEIINRIEEYLSNNMNLNINKTKTGIYSCWHGVEFLGSFLKPRRKYISNKCLKRIKKKINTNEKTGWINKDIEKSINSFLGVFCHYSSYNLRKEIFSGKTIINKLGIFNESYTKYCKIWL